MPMSKIGQTLLFSIGEHLSTWLIDKNLAA